MAECRELLTRDTAARSPGEIHEAIRSRISNGQLSILMGSYRKARPRETESPRNVQTLDNWSVKIHWPSLVHGNNRKTSDIQHGWISRQLSLLQDHKGRNTQPEVAGD
jgi:hypothetical protein